MFTTKLGTYYRSIVNRTLGNADTWDVSVFTHDQMVSNSNCQFDDGIVLRNLTIDELSYFKWNM